MKPYVHVVPWLLSHATVRSAPIEPRDLEAGGIGVELEMREFELHNLKGVGVGMDLVDAVKGSPIAWLSSPGGNERKEGLTCGAHWDLTAEHSGTEETSGISDLRWEYTIHGQTLKLRKTDNPEDDLVLPVVWKDIRDKLRILDPKKDDKFTIEGFEATFGRWTLTRPSNYNEDAVSPGIQVTTGLPMEAIQDLISIGTTEEDTNGNEKLNFVLIAIPKAKYANMVKITREDLKDVYETKEEITNEMLGFYSLLMSYVKIAVMMLESDRDGPKQKLSIMPRTDWRTIYNLYAKGDDETRRKKCRPKKKNPNQTLLEIVKELAKKKGMESFSETATFKWKKPDRSPPLPPPRRSRCNNRIEPRSGVDIHNRWASKSTDYKTGTLSIKIWLEELDREIDSLSVMDKLVWDGQIGGLGDRLEAPLYPRDDETGYPIFELRDLVALCMKGTEQRLKDIEIQIKKWHKTPPSGQFRKRALGGKCELPGNDQKCEGKQAPNSKGKCEDCPRGMKPNPFKTQCVKDDGNTDQDVKKKKEGKWEETKRRMKERWDKNQEERKKEQDDKKQKEEEEKKDRKKERMGKCLPLVSLSTGYPEDGFPLETDFFSEDYIDSEDIMQHWPSELDDVPSANIDTDEYVDAFLKAMDDLTWVPWGGGAKKIRRTVPEIATSTEVAVVAHTTERAVYHQRRFASTEVAVVSHITELALYHEERFVKALFTLIRNFFIRVGTLLVRRVNRLKSLKDKGGPRIAEKRKGAKYADQKKSADEVAKDKNWKNCIYGKQPEKNGPGN